MTTDSNPQVGELWAHRITGRKVKIESSSDDVVRYTHQNGISAQLTIDNMFRWYIKETPRVTRNSESNVTITPTKNATKGKKVDLPLEVFNDKPVDAKKAWEELQRICNC